MRINVARPLFLLMCCLAFGSAVADSSFRCGGKLIAVGMSQSDVIRYCGPPKSRTDESVPVLNGSHQVVGKTMKYRWTYESYSASRVLEFSEDKLVAIE